MNTALLMGLHYAPLRVLPIVFIAFLSACSLPAHNEPPPPRLHASASRTSEAELLLAYVLQVRALTPAEFPSEKDRMRAEFAAEKSGLKRTKLAILLAFAPLTSPADEGEFQTLIEPLLRVTSESPSSADSAPRAIALILVAAQERKRLRDQLRETTVRSQGYRREEQAAQAEARILRAQVEDLEKKLNALKSIERSVTSRSAEGGVK